MNFSNSVFKKIYKRRTVVLLLSLICLFACVVCVVYFSSTEEETSKSTNQTQALSQPNHVLCLLVPYRDRFDELLEFVPHMSKFLDRQSIEYHIIVINHLPGEYRFNKGATCNAGFHIMREKFPECDYIALNDIDTLPLTDEVSYGYPGDDVYHGIPFGFHPVRLYAKRSYIGGILLMSNKVFMRLNGFGNDFWGWGIEMVNFLRRIEKYSVPLRRPVIRFTNRDNSFKHIHGKFKTRDMPLCPSQVISTAAKYFLVDDTGLSDVNFTISSENQLTIDGFPFSLFNINIGCIFELTPWCKPFCRENITSPKNIWEFDDEDIVKDPVLKSAIQWRGDSNGDSSLWNRIIEQE